VALETFTGDMVEENPMSYTVDYNPETHIIETKVNGVVKLDTFKQIFSQGVQLAKEKDCFLLLNDFRSATIELSTLDLYSLPEILAGISRSMGISVNRLRRALVVTLQYTRDAIFAEDVAVNRGQHAKFFHDIEDARKWLLGKC
jgi:hypothetical protein